NNIYLLCRYGHWTFGVFEKLGIPGPKPMMYWGTVNRYNQNFHLNGDLYDAVNAAEDDQWRRIRNHVTPSFTSGRIKVLVLIGGEEARLIESSENLQLVDSSEFCHIRRFTQCPFIPGHKVVREPAAYFQQSMGKRRGTSWTGRQSIPGQHRATNRTNNDGHTLSHLRAIERLQSKMDNKEVKVITIKEKSSGPQTRPPPALGCAQKSCP
ncbi:hypothetical protein AMECASPLE_038612, partial [Ameca splendens]